jgi:four helix bundle protein
MRCLHEQGIRALPRHRDQSANETEHHLLSARELDLISPDDWQKYSAETVEVRKMIFGYRKKVAQSARAQT